MSDVVKINSLEFENIKRIKAVKLEPTKDGLTIIGGRNSQGKTSVLDAIAWVLGGDTFKPSKPQRDGSITPPYLKVELSNGLLVERKGENGSLKITDPSGSKAGQKLLDSFIEKLALNLPKFLEINSKEKAKILLKIIGLEEEIYRLEQEEKQLYNTRLGIGQIADQKKKYAEGLEYFEDLPSEAISASDLIKKQQEILAKNGENNRLRQKALLLNAERDNLAEKVKLLKEELEKYGKLLLEKESELEIASKTSKELKDESTLELEESIANIEKTNIKIYKNLEKEKALDEASNYEKQYGDLTKKIEDLRNEKIKLLNNAKLPLDGLTVEDGELSYNGQKWDNMSSSQQLKVATAIIKSLNPSCGFVLLDKLEQMDTETLSEFGKWANREGLQIIATRVSSGDECTIWIDDGNLIEKEKKDDFIPKKWSEGSEF